MWITSPGSDLVIHVFYCLQYYKDFNGLTALVDIMCSGMFMPRSEQGKWLHDSMKKRLNLHKRFFQPT